VQQLLILHLHDSKTSLGSNSVIAIVICILGSCSIPLGRPNYAFDPTGRTDSALVNPLGRPEAVAFF